MGKNIGDSTQINNWGKESLPFDSHNMPAIMGYEKIT